MGIKFAETTELPEWRLLFFCPGCECAHFVQINPECSPCWTWNGDEEKPTVTPSIWVRMPGQECHSVITDGVIHFISDSHHKLAGQSMELPDWDSA